MFKIIRACLLVLLLSCAAQAGEIQNGAPQPPPTPPPSEIVQEEAEATEESDQSNGLVDTLTEAALSVLDDVLALL
ncbi:MAG TPA: hypothetical protein VF588_21830 [Pyrinomonadaceae bacterium]|jgi:hypothetical protein